VGSSFHLPRVACALVAGLLAAAPAVPALAQAPGLSNACLGWGEEPAPEPDVCLAAADRVLSSPVGITGPQGRRALFALRAQARRIASTDPARAATLWERALALDPRDGESHLEVARLRAARGRYAEAEALAVRAAKLGQARNNVFLIKEARTLLAHLELRRGDGTSAAELFRQGIGRWDGTQPSDGTHYGCAYQGFGELYGALGSGAADAPGLDLSAAVDAFITGPTAGLAGWSAARDDAASWTLRALLWLHERDYARVEAMLAAPPPGVHLAEAAVVRAHLAIVRQDFDAALAAVGDRVPEAPIGDGSNGFARARLLARSGDLAHGWARSNRDEHPLALLAFERLAAREPDDLLGGVGLGNSLLALGRLDEAEAAFDAVLARDPQNRFALAERAMVYFVRGDDERAEIGFVAAMQHAPDNYTCPYEGLGLLYLRDGRRGEAAELFERAIEINPAIEYRKYDELARIRLAEGDLDAAEALLERSLRNHPHGSDARRLMDDLRRRRAGR
jgi:tetratricopeptide (TPR) repeat protein